MTVVTYPQNPAMMAVTELLSEVDVIVPRKLKFQAKAQKIKAGYFPYSLYFTLVVC
jgi:hypothetical protein